MGEYKESSAVRAWLTEFRQISDKSELKEMVEQVMARLEREDAAQALMMLLSEERVMEPRDGKPTGWVSGAIWPYDWRCAAYRLLIEKLCSRTEAFSFTCRMATDSDSERRTEAVEVLPRYFQKHPETLAMLMRSADNDWSYAKIEALKGIVDRFGHHPDARSYLFQAAQSDRSWPLAKDAVRALGKHHAAHPETRPLVETLVRSSNDEVATAAVQVLASAFPKDESAFQLVLELAQATPPRRGVRAIFFTLVEFYRERSEPLPFLMETARIAESPSVREVALTALFTYAADDPRVLPVLLQQARDEKASFARGAAIKGLATRYADNAEAGALVFSVLASDPSETVRATAAETIGTHHCRNPKAVDCLINSLRNDRDEGVRQQAGDALAEHFADNLEARRALKSSGYRTPLQRLHDTFRAPLGIRL